MPRIWEHDVKEAVKVKLVAEFNAMIDTIRIERSDSTIPYANNITYTDLTYNYPEITIDIDGESDVDPDNELLCDNIDIEPEIYPVKIGCIIMSQSNSINYYADYYNEAFKRILHGCTLTGITWCRVKKTKQQELLDENMQSYKSCGCTLEIRIN
jgi:hypothetical protein